MNSEQLIVNSIDTLSAPLKLQSLALAPVEIMAGLVKIDTKGNVEIAGNLFVAGKVEASGLTLKAQESEEPDSGKLLSLIDLEGSEVANVDASGSAEFAQLATGRLVIAGAEATTSTSLAGQVIETNATAGSATIPAGSKHIFIKNNSVTDYSLIYLTPLSSTQNRVLYVKSKEGCSDPDVPCEPYFVAGFSGALSIDVDFNWWIIEISEPPTQE